LEAQANKPDLLTSRINDFNDIVIENNQKYPHFFINVVFPKFNPKLAELELANTHYDISSLLNLVHSMEPSNVNTIAIKKTPSVVRAEEMLKSFANGKVEGFVDHLSTISKTVADKVKLIKSKVKDLVSDEARLKSIQEELDEKDTDSLIRIESSTVRVEEPGSWTWKSRTLTIRSEYIMAKITKTIGASTWCYWDGEEDFSNDRKTVTQRIQSAIFGGLQGTIVAWATSREINKVRIGQLIQQRDNLKSGIVDLNVEIDELKKDQVVLENEMKQFKESISRYQNILEFIAKPTMTALSFQNLTHRYSKLSSGSEAPLIDYILNELNM